MTKPVFISYSTADTATTEQVRDHLETAGIACWMAPRDIAPGEDYAEQIINAIEGCTVLLLVLSERSNHSQYVQKEVERAIAKRKVVIPFRIHNVTPSRSLEFFISNAQWIDAIQTPLAAHLPKLVQAIRIHAGEAAAPMTLPAVQPVTPPHNLPHQLTPFVGRTTDLTALDALLADEKIRLVTILGPGGMGKTRLALALAEQYVSAVRFTHGIYFIGLGALSEVRYIVPTLAHALALSLEVGGHAPTAQQQILDYLHAKQMLLVFDNFEHLLEGADLLVQILQSAPGVRILATSRERLRVPGEQIFPLQGLDFGKSSQRVNTANMAAVQLFLQSARLVQPDLEPSAEQLSHIAEICRLVDGMPLGIELAAAWSEVLSPAEIADEIQRSLDFLEAKWRGVAEHHSSMRAVFGSTWQRLDAVEQQVFARLTSFRGGFTREAAEQVAAASLRLLSSLAGKSLIQHDAAHGRYALHELMRQFGAEHLRTSPQAWEEVQDRHCAYYASLLQQQEPRLKGREQLAARVMLETEVDNLRAAWARAVTADRLDDLARCLDSFDYFLHIKLWHDQRALLFQKAAEAIKPRGQEERRRVFVGQLLSKLVRAQTLIVEIGGQTSHSAADQAQLEESLVLVQQRGDARTIADILYGLSAFSADDKESQQLKRTAAVLYEQSGDRWSTARLMEALGWTAKNLGQYEEAIQYFERGMLLGEQVGDGSLLGDILNIYGELRRALGEYPEALRLAQAALAARTAAGNKRGIAYSLYLLGDLAWRIGDNSAALRYAEQSRDLFAEIGLHFGVDIALSVLGNIAYTSGDAAEARRQFGLILRPKLARDDLQQVYIDWALLGMAAVLAGAGQSARAAEVLDHVIHFPTAWQEIRDRAKALLTHLPPEVQNRPPQPARPLVIVVQEILDEDSKRPIR